MSNAVNSIYNIREFVFEKNMYTYGEIDGFRRDDFKGHEDVYGVLKNAKKYWGMMMTRCATL
jgi:hypothetical protein